MATRLVPTFELRATLARLLDLLLRRDRADDARLAGEAADTNAATLPAAVEPAETTIAEANE